MEAITAHQRWELKQLWVAIQLRLGYCQVKSQPKEELSALRIGSSSGISISEYK